MKSSFAPLVTRRRALGLLGSAGLAAGVVLDTSPALAAVPRRVYDLVPIQVADGVWMIEGATEYFSDKNGGAIVNCALIETLTGLVIIDTGASLRYGQALQDVAAQISPIGVAAVFNTHHHPDHFFGNQVFADKPIYALAGTQKLAEQDGDGFSDNMYRLLGDWMRGTEPVPPNQALTSSSITIGGRDFSLYPLEGHTDADLAILDRKSGILIAGDLAFLDRAPTTPHADLNAWRGSLDSLASLNAGAIIPGHGPLDTSGASLIQTRAYLDWLDKTLRQAATEGLSMVEVMNEDIPPDYAAMGAMPQEFHRSVAHLFPDIEREILPVSNP